MTVPGQAQRSEAGFTLVEMLVVIVILGIIGTLLAQAIILGLRTTADTANRVAGTDAVGTLNRYFYGDVHSADQVTTTSTSPTDPACGGVAGVIVHLSWTDQGIATDVFYTYDPPTGGDQALNRVTCVGAGAAVTTPLGRFDNDASTRPVTLTCGAETPCTPPTEVTLSVRSDPTAPRTILTAVRRTGSA